MGAWGVGLFQNDVALEVKDTYVKKLQVGKSNEEAFNETVNELNDMTNDADDKIDFWFALASLMFDYGRLTPDVKNTALEIINSNSDDRWDAKDTKKRNQAVESLKEKLLSQQPEEVKVKIVKKRTPKIKPDEIYYFVLDDENLRNENFYNCYVYVLVDSWTQYDNRIKDLGDEHALIYLKISDHAVSDIKELDSIPFFNYALNVDNENRKIEDKRILIDNQGFSDMKKRLTYFGTYSFQREPYEKIFRWDEWQSVYENYKGENEWNGKSTLWSCLIDQHIVPALRKYGMK
ncbi:MAG: hypothetical protein IJ091_05090 [Oscillospiraceae bacterium]|nr:hypothetical protein [Oscillospiraceae bacterium]